MALADHITAPARQYDKVEAAYDGMDEADKATFKQIIEDPEWGHQAIAKALCAVGYDIDRFQVYSFREKLSKGRVKL